MINRVGKINPLNHKGGQPMLIRVALSATQKDL